MILCSDSCHHLIDMDIHEIQPNMRIDDTAVGTGSSAVPPAFHFRLRQTSAGQVGATGAVHAASRRWLRLRFASPRQVSFFR